MTGAGAGIGRTACFRFAWEGARVITVDLDRTSVAKLADEIGEPGVPQVADLSGRKQIDRIVAGCTKHFGGVGQVSGTMPASGSISGSQDAFYSANGTTTSASTNLVIQSAAVTMPDSLHYRFTIKVENLSTLVVSPTLGGDGCSLVGAPGSTRCRFPSFRSTGATHAKCQSIWTR